MNKRIILVIVVIMVLLLLGCSAEKQNREGNQITNDRVSPAAEIGLGEDSAIEISLGLINETDQPLAAKDDFAGQWVLTNQEGQTRAGGNLYTFSSLEPNESEFPLTYKLMLESDMYSLQWGAPSVGTTVVEFKVISGENGTGVGTVQQQTTDEFLLKQAE